MTNKELLVKITKKRRYPNFGNYTLIINQSNSKKRNYRSRNKINLKISKVAKN
jgi:hypothetical protein